ncbi:MAG: tryptophan synthase subunit alpha [Spirochaetaceae bacterium]|nr:MAG: tryptophan synthase subunit alpha [Spirochaetaceae bacterium]TVR28894.1 MAG: tryptophan synthase subunit alpha [Spirochaetaceae bacterium]
MAHMIPWFPDRERSFTIARALLDAGVGYLEVQFPYSDPTADGPAIQKACADALDAGFRVADGFEYLERLRAHRDVPIFLMSYAGLVYRRGVAEFVRRAADHGVTGLIVPDLPPGSDEGLYEAAQRYAISAVPVLVVTARQARIDAVAAVRPAYIYAALRSGITGRRTVIDSDSLAFLDRLRPIGAELMAGFGVQSAEQVQALAGHVETVVVGSAFVRVVEDVLSRRPAEAARHTDTLYEAVHAVARELVGS